MQMRTHFLLFLFIVSSSVSSAPWIEANDIGLRADIQLLSDTGILDMPVTTYPLMWTSIAHQLKRIAPNSLSNSQQIAFSHLRRKMNSLNSKSIDNKASLYLSSNERRFTSFGSNDFERSTATISTEYTGTNFAGKFQANYNKAYNLSTNQDKLNIDGSYIAYRYSNWVIDIGAVDKWWGPGYDTSLILSTNARPLPAITIKRDNTQAFETPWLSWIGPWTFTAQIAQLEHDRFVPDAKLWSSRATFKPFKRLELGLSWSYQWGGKDQPESLDDFVRGLLGRTECADGTTTCGEDNLTKLGNQLAGFDGRWGDTIFKVPYAIYAQSIGEDSPSPGTLQITDKAFLYGIETQFSIGEQQILVNYEYTDTQVSCASAEDTSQDCYYEHTIYRSGYRYRQRSIGSTYDNDAETNTITFVGRLINGDSWLIKLKNAKLNTNNRDLYPNDPLLGNSVSKVAETLTQLSFEYHLILDSDRFTFGNTVGESKINLETDKHYNFYFKYEYNFTQ
ncbi:MAG: hypothetical protein COB38_01225 [Gammaproteobacteria bacterium]|nr:MAG: hypothetical protein COB38_01225 [Gammaproteobacteria bacterium]